MPRPKHGTHPDHVRTDSSRSVPTDKTIADGAAVTIPVTPNPKPGARHSMADVSALLLRDDGWLRVVPDRDGKVIWWKWKFTHGSWAGFYCMVRGDVGENGIAIDVLLRKLEHIDLGASRPTRDSYYDQS